MTLRAASLAFLMLALVACGGGSQQQAGGVDPATPDAGCDGSCADTPVSYTHLTLPTRSCQCRSRGSRDQ